MYQAKYGKVVEWGETIELGLEKGVFTYNYIIMHMEVINKEYFSEEGVNNYTFGEGVNDGTHEVGVDDVKLVNNGTTDECVNNGIIKIP